MKQKNVKKKSSINPPVICNCQIDYNKLAESIIYVQKKVNEGNQTISPLEKVSTIKKIIQIIRGKRNTQTTFTVGLFSLVLSLFCKLVSLFSGMFSIAEVIYGFANINWASESISEIVIAVVFTLMIFFIGIMLTVIFHIMSLEMEKTDDKNVVFQAFSSMVSLVALIVALVAFYK